MYVICCQYLGGKGLESGESFRTQQESICRMPASTQPLLCQDCPFRSPPLSEYRPVRSHCSSSVLVPEGGSLWAQLPAGHYATLLGFARLTGHRVREHTHVWKSTSSLDVVLERTQEEKSSRHVDFIGLRDMFLIFLVN